MTPFLHQTAEHLYTRFKDHLASVAVVFPNNRARLFFSEYLYRVVGKPVWTPGFITISDLFREQSHLGLADPMALVGYLYRIYLKEHGKEESLDEFYHWGEILLNDFDDVDKNLADARQLFRNIREQAAYTDTLEHLTEEQVASIRLFFQHFDPDRKTELKQRFIENWNILSAVYNGFRQLLEEKGLAYEGMLHRQVIEKLRKEGPSGFRFEQYAFVGFNVLNGCEEALFSLLHKAGKALFYWDYDVFYLENPRHEAGRFMRHNVEKFPNELDKTAFNVFEPSRKRIQFVAAPTENVQARFLPHWIKGLETSPNGFRPEETAVTLCNERLLLPVLHSVPDEVPELNVTMGFPLDQTPLYTLLNEIAALHSDGFLNDPQERFNHRFVLPILQHPLFRQVSEKAERIEKELREKNRFRPSAGELKQDDALNAVFTPRRTPEELAHCLLEICRRTSRNNAGQTEHENVDRPAKTDEYDPLYAETAFRCYTLINRMLSLMQEGLIHVSLQTFRKLLQKATSRAHVPFSGEPVKGLQIMGMLETRNLDFKNILLLSVNEGLLPQNSGETSFIPYNLRKGFGLTTSEHKDSIYAYYFFRLLQRAENITLVYNTSTEGTNRGEMSRFMLQLLVESRHPVEHLHIHSGIELTTPRFLEIKKTDSLLQQLQNLYNPLFSQKAGILSPTALNTLMDCSLRFYLRYLAGLKTPNELSEDIDGATLGNFFHHAAEYIYTDVLLRKAGLDFSTSGVVRAIETGYINRALEKGSISGVVNASDLEPWLKGFHSIEKVVDHFFRVDFFQLPNEQEPLEYNGEQRIKHRIVTGFLQTLLKMDLERAPFEIVALEHQISETCEFQTLSGKTTVQLGGTIDRVDKKDGGVRIVDYKTGGKPSTPETIDALFENTATRSSYIFQTFLYACMFHRKKPHAAIAPHILYIHKAGADDFSTSVFIGNRQQKKEIENIHAYEARFREKLTTLLQTLFNPMESFRQTEHLDKCTYCDYKAFCRR